jgi:tetratricopeptide (TPR) repeat protein
VTTLHGELLHARFDNVSLPAIQNRIRLALCLFVTGAFAEAMTILTEAVQMAEALDRSYERVGVYARVGLLHLWQGNVHLAIPVLERGLALAEDANVSIFLPVYLPYLAVAYGRAGRTPEALARLDQAMARQDVGAGSYVAEACLLVGRLAEAHTVARRALENQQRRKERGGQVRTLWLLGEIARQGEPADLEQAEAHYRQALALAEELGVRPFQAHCHYGLGRLYQQTGQYEQAYTALSTAIELYRAMEMTFWVSEAEVALAEGQHR